MPVLALKHERMTRPHGREPQVLLDLIYGSARVTCVQCATTILSANSISLLSFVRIRWRETLRKGIRVGKERSAPILIRHLRCRDSLKFERDETLNVFFLFRTDFRCDADRLN